jgi:hypothetical protein
VPRKRYIFTIVEAKGYTPRKVERKRYSILKHHTFFFDISRVVLGYPWRERIQIKDGGQWSRYRMQILS